jgi:hypothetical protein
MKKRSLVILPLVISVFVNATPAFANPINSIEPVIEVTQTQQDLFNKFQLSMKLQGIETLLFIVDDIPANQTLHDFTFEKLNQTNNVKTIAIVIAKNKINKVGTKPALRIETKNYTIPQKDLDLLLESKYYPTLKQSGFDIAFSSLLDNLAQQTVELEKKLVTQDTTHKTNDLSWIWTVMQILGVGGAFVFLVQILQKITKDKSPKASNENLDNLSEPSNSSSSSFRSTSSKKSNPSSKKSGNRSSHYGSSSSSSLDSGYYSSGSSYDSSSSSSDSGYSGGGDSGGFSGGGD